MTTKIPFNVLKPEYERHRAEYIAAATRVLDSGWYVLGTEVEAFEREFARMAGASFCVGLNSGLDALSLALRAIGISSGDEVIVQANTYIATVLAITGNSAKPILVEPDEFYGLDPKRLKAAISSRTKAILPVHLYGCPCEMGEIAEIAAERGVPIVEDCAQSHGAAYSGKMCGTFGKIGCYSFFPTKNLGAFGDAGAIVTDDAELAKRVKMLRNYGSERKYYNEMQGVNSRLDEMQAALLRVKLSHIDEALAEREKIVKFYLSNIKNDRVKLPQARPNCRHVYHLFVVETDHGEAFRKHLEERGIGTQIHYPIPPHLSKAYSEIGYKRGDFPITERMAQRMTSLPLFLGISEEQMRRVVDAVNEW